MDLSGFDYYIITIHQAFEMQELKVTNGEEATEVAQRLRSFLKGSYKVKLTGVNDGEAIFDGEGEYKEHINGFSEEVAF